MALLVLKLVSVAVLVKVVPDSLKKDIETAKSDVTRFERELESKQSRVDRIASRFEADKDRYRELSARTRIK